MIQRLYFLSLFNRWKTVIITYNSVKRWKLASNTASGYFEIYKWLT